MQMCPLFELSDLSRADLFPQAAGKGIGCHVSHVQANIVAVCSMEPYFGVKSFLGREDVAVRVFIEPLQVFRFLIVEFLCLHGYPILSLTQRRKGRSCSWYGMVLCDSYDECTSNIQLLCQGNSRRKTHRA